MKEKQLYLSVTALTMIFTNQLFAEEPPILQQEVEFHAQSEIKRSQELLRLMEQERRMAQEQAEAEAIRQKEAKQRAADQARRAKDAEAKRVAEQQGEKDKVAVELKDNRLVAEKKKEEETDSYQQLLHRMDEYKTADKPSMVSGNNSNKFSATPSDLALAKDFLNKLPLGCSSGTMITSIDGTINIRITCNNYNQSMDGLISIKDGVFSKSGEDKKAGNATPSDLALAKDFLNKLPLACSSSHITVATNDAVNIHIVCYGSNQSMDGLISIKNGILTHIAFLYKL